MAALPPQECPEPVAQGERPRQCASHAKASHSSVAAGPKAAAACAWTAGLGANAKGRRHHTEVATPHHSR